MLLTGYGNAVGVEQLASFSHRNRLVGYARTPPHLVILIVGCGDVEYTTHDMKHYMCSDVVRDP